MNTEYCNEDPGTKPNSIVWKGFFDNDTKQYVCFECRQLHYDEKKKKGHANKYTEFPVPIPIPLAYPKQP